MDGSDEDDFYDWDKGARWNKNDDWNKNDNGGINRTWSIGSTNDSSIGREADNKIPLTFYCVYTREDAMLFNQLEKHLSPLRRWEGLLSQWHDRQIIVGTAWTALFSEYLAKTSIILLLISPDFLASDYSYSAEIKHAVERHKQGDTRVIPIILRPCDWRATPFANLQYLPRNGKAVTAWNDPDDAFADIVRSIQLVCRELMQLSARDTLQQSPHISPQKSYQLFEVFVKSGTPTVTFVEPAEFEALKQALAQPGRGVVIEGPSGVGKTTAVEKAVEFLANLERNVANFRKRRPNQKNVQMLSARKPNDRLRLQTLRQWHKDIVIIDDFHRLDLELRQDIVDYLKDLADTSSKSQKLVIIGIPRTGQALVNASFDVATRIDVFRFGHVSDDIIFQMIEKGEAALNIFFERKTEVVLAANGSLNIAQFLCFNLAQMAQISKTSSELQMVPSDLYTAQSLVTRDLSRKFSGPVRHFVSMGGSRNFTSLRFLAALVTNENGFLSLPLLKSQEPDVARQIERFLTERWMEQLYHECPECEQHFFFDSTTQALVVDDPQLVFYLKQLRFSTLARDAGKVAMLVQRKVFVSYSHKDTHWLERLRVHLKPIEREGIIDPWDDKRIAAGIQWRGAIREALETSKVAVLLISADFLASDFIAEHELPILLSQVESGGTVILPIIASPSLFSETKLSAFQAVNQTPLSALPYSEQEEVFVKVAMRIKEHLTKVGTKQQGNSGEAG